MKLFFDTEFTGLRKNTTLVSIGLISEDRRTFYAELTDYDEKQCDVWIKKNVLEHLYTRYPRNIEDAPYIPNLHVGTKQEVAKSLYIWFKQFETVELVSDVCHYDFVLLIDLFGSAFDLPKNVNPACHDINQDIANHYGISEREAFDKSREEIVAELCEKPVTGRKHNALYDAEVIRAIYKEICHD